MSDEPNWIVIEDGDGKPCAVANSKGKPQNCLLTIEADFADDDERELFAQWLATKLNTT